MGVGRPTLVADVLADYGAAIRQAIARYLPSGVPERYLYDLLAEYPGRGGKMMRPSICIATTTTGSWPYPKTVGSSSTATAANVGTLIMMRVSVSRPSAVAAWPLAILATSLSASSCR